MIYIYIKFLFLFISSILFSTQDKVRAAEIHKSTLSLLVKREVDDDGFDIRVADHLISNMVRRQEEQINVLLERILAQFTPDTRLLEATEGEVRVHHVRAVDLRIHQHTDSQNR